MRLGKPVASCHSEGTQVSTVPGAAVVALAGSPNVGKSTLYNALTGLRRDTGNWPGTTVAVGRGVWTLPHGEAALIDLPGAYSLDPVSPDEELTRALLVEQPVAERPDVVVVVASAAHLSRGLYLLAQLRETDQRCVLALTMGDVAERRGVTVDAAALSAAVGVPTVLLDPRHGTGLTGLADAVERSRAAAAPTPRETGDGAVDETDELAVADARFDWIQAAVGAATTRDDRSSTSLSDRIDRVATSRVGGPILFLAAMYLVFQLTTTIAAPVQTFLGDLVDGPVSSAVTAAMTAVGLGDTWVTGFVVDGLVAGVGMLLTFVPLMAIMFFLLALLEDSGYMARAAVVTDRLMRTIGLPGRAFLPLIVGFGCNVPAISGTRVLPDARDRLLTALLVPFTSCSARLTVYVLVAATFFGSSAGTVVFVMYLVSILLVVLAGLLLRTTLLKRVDDDPLVIDLPAYQLPVPRLLVADAWVRVKGFLRTASGIIVATVVIVWALSATPLPGAQGGFGEVAISDSVYAGAAKVVAPVFDPAGFGAWETTGALAVGFVAKEALISSWAQTYATAEPTDSDPGSLGQNLQTTFAQTSGGHTTAAVWAFLVFLLAYTPCVATIAAQRREIGLRWTAFSVGFNLTVAWVLSVAVFQVLRVVI